MLKTQIHMNPGCQVSPGFFLKRNIMKEEYLKLLDQIKNPLCPHLFFSISSGLYNTAFCQIELDIKKTVELLENLKELKELLKGEL